MYLDASAVTSNKQKEAENNNVKQQLLSAVNAPRDYLRTHFRSNFVELLQVSWLGKQCIKS